MGRCRPGSVGPTFLDATEFAHHLRAGSDKRIVTATVEDDQNIVVVAAAIGSARHRTSSKYNEMLSVAAVARTRTVLARVSFVVAATCARLAPIRSEVRFIFRADKPRAGLRYANNVRYTLRPGDASALALSARTAASRDQAQRRNAKPACDSGWRVRDFQPISYLERSRARGARVLGATRCLVCLKTVLRPIVPGRAPENNRS